LENIKFKEKASKIIVWDIQKREEALEKEIVQAKREALEKLEKRVLYLHEWYAAQSFRGQKYEGAEMASKAILAEITRQLKELGE